MQLITNITSLFSTLTIYKSSLSGKFYDLMFLKGWWQQEARRMGWSVQNWPWGQTPQGGWLQLCRGQGKLFLDYPALMLRLKIKKNQNHSSMTSRLMWGQKPICQSGPGAWASCNASVNCKKLARRQPVYEPRHLSVVPGVPEYGYMCWISQLKILFKGFGRIVQQVNFPQISTCIVVGITLHLDINEGMQHVLMFIDLGNLLWLCAAVLCSHWLCHCSRQFCVVSSWCLQCRTGNAISDTSDQCDHCYL